MPNDYALYRPRLLDYLATRGMPIDTTIRGLSVTGTLVTGDWSGGPDIGYIEYDPYIEDMDIRDEHGDDMQSWLTPEAIEAIEAMAIKEACDAALAATGNEV